MEKVILDGIELSLGDLDKESICREVSSLLQRQNKVISSLKVDGVDMDLQAFAAMEGGTKAEFSSIDVMALVKDSLDTAEEYIPKLKKGVLAAADLIEKEKAKESLDVVMKAMEGMDWTLKTMERCLFLMGCKEEPLFLKFQDTKASLEKLMGSVADLFEGGKRYKASLSLREEVPALLDSLEDILLSLQSQTSGKVN